MSVDLEELKRLLEKATPGPWGWGEGVCGPYLDRQAHAPDWSCNDSGREAVWLGGSVLDDDMALIAALHNTAPALIEELEQAESRLREAQADAERLRGGLKWYADGHHYDLDDWDTCSGESQNWLFPPLNEDLDAPSWVIDNGGIARAILEGHSINPNHAEDDEITLPPAARAAEGEKK